MAIGEEKSPQFKQNEQIHMALKGVLINNVKYLIQLELIKSLKDLLYNNNLYLPNSKISKTLTCYKKLICMYKEYQMSTTNITLASLYASADLRLRK